MAQPQTRAQEHAQEHAATIPRLLDRIASEFPDRILISEPGHEAVRADQLRSEVAATAHRLGRLGVRRDTLTAVECHDLTLYEFARVYLGVVWAGAVPVLAPEADFAPATRLGAEVLIAREPDADGTPRRLGCDELFVAEPGQPRPEPEFARDDVLDIVFTSGTTGSWKSVVSTHTQWTTALPAPSRREQGRAVAQGGVPWAASAGVHGVFLHHLARAVTSVWAGTPEGLIKQAAQHGAAELHMTPHSLRALVASRDAVPDDWAGQVRTIKTVGGSVPTRLGQLTLKTFPRARLAVLYGLTEAGSALSLKVFDPKNPDSIGRPLPGTQIRIVDEAGRPVPDGTEGAIQVRRADVAPLSYADEASAAQDTFQEDGWVATGDRGLVDRLGEVRLVGRSKELLFLECGRRSPQAIEDHYDPHVPDDVDFAVVGVPRSGGWDEIVLFLAGDVGEEVVSRVREAVTAAGGDYAPHHVLTVASIPRTPMGKVRRGELDRVYRAMT